MSTYLNYAIERKKDGVWEMVSKPLYTQGSLRDIFQLICNYRFFTGIPKDASKEFTKYYTEHLDNFKYCKVGYATIEDLKNLYDSYSRDTADTINKAITKYSLDLVKYCCKDSPLPENNVLNEAGFDELTEDTEAIHSIIFLMMQLSGNYFDTRLIYWLG